MPNETEQYRDTTDGLVTEILHPPIAGFHSRGKFSAWWSTPNGNTVIGPI